MKILHTADWHLGAKNQPSIYNELAVPKLIKAARDFGIKYVLVVGDIFDRPNPDQQTKDYLTAQLIGCNDINFIFTIGNHDYANKAKSYNSLNTYSLIGPKLGNVFVCVDGYNNINNDVDVLVLPDDITQYKNVKKRNVDNLILAWHGILPGMVVENFDFSGCKDFTKEVMEYFDATYFALGDIHRPSEIINNCYYSGSLTQKTYSCVSGIRLVDTCTGESENIDLGMPKRYTVDVPEQMINEDEIIRFIKCNIANGSLVKIKTHLPFSKWVVVDKSKIEESLKNDFLEVNIKNESIQENTEKRKNIKQFSAAKSLREELEVIVDTNEYANKEIILKGCLEYLEKGSDRERT